MVPAKNLFKDFPRIKNKILIKIIIEKINERLVEIEEIMKIKPESDILRRNYIYIDAMKKFMQYFSKKGLHKNSIDNVYILRSYYNVLSDIIARRPTIRRSIIMDLFDDGADNASIVKKLCEEDYSFTDLATHLDLDTSTPIRDTNPLFRTALPLSSTHTLPSEGGSTRLLAQQTTAAPISNTSDKYGVTPVLCTKDNMTSNDHSAHDFTEDESCEHDFEGHEESNFKKLVIATETDALFGTSVPLFSSVASRSSQLDAGQTNSNTATTSESSHVSEVDADEPSRSSSSHSHQLG